jgi:hypothetical protein
MGLGREIVISKIVPLVAQQSAVLTRLITASVLSLFISGCVGTGEQVTASAAGIEADTKTVTVAGQSVVLGRAANYCFNDKQSRLTISGAFVVMVPCDPFDEGSTAKGLILVNVLAEQGIMDAIKSRDLEAYFQSDAGRAALSRKGNADNLTVLGTMHEDSIYYVHTQDADGPIIPDTTDDQWRVFMVVADRLVSVSVVNFLDDKMSEGMVFAHMESIARRIKSLN